MDIFAHGVYNIALQKTIKQKQTTRQLLQAFWWGIMPDLLAFGLPFFANIFHGSLDHHVIGASGYDFAAQIYPYTHSLVIFAAVFVLVRLVWRRWYLPLLGWGLHIVFDMPLHTPEFFPTPFLFPLSDWTLPFGIPWSTPWIWVSSWVLAIGWIVWVFRKGKN